MSDRWEEIVSAARHDLESGKPLDEIAFQLAKRVIETHDLIVRSKGALARAARAQIRCAELADAISRVNERTKLALVRTSVILGRQRNLAD